MTRQDGWTQEDDDCLSTTVLNCIENDNTQLYAFEIVAEKTNRTAAACGFRWNSNLRKKFEKEIKEAKLKRNALKTTKKHVITTHDAGRSLSLSPNIDLVINSLRSFKEQFEEMKQTILNLQNRNKELEQQLAEKPFEANEELKNLLEIIKRAEKLGLTSKEKPAILGRYFFVAIVCFLTFK